MAGSLRSLAAIALLTGAGVPLGAQGPVALAGRVIRLAGPDSVPVDGVTVSAHRVGKTAQGVVDSLFSGPGGSFRFRLRGDSAAIYLVSARFGGVEYFSEAVRSPGSGTLLVVVSDTSSTAPVALTGRHVIISRPDPSGARAILDLLTIRNSSVLTRVASDTLSPTWRVVIPAGSLEPAVEEGDVSAAAVAFHGDTLLLFAPVGPGRKSMLLSYRLPVTETHPRWSAPSDSFDLLVEEGDATVRGAGLAAAPPVTLMERQLLRWTANPPSGPDGEVRFAATGSESRKVLWVLVVLVAGALLGAGVLVLGRRPGLAPAGGAPPTDLIGQLARLDARYVGREREVLPAEWEQYLAQRRRLKAEAESAGLARRSARP